MTDEYTRQPRLSRLVAWLSERRVHGAFLTVGAALVAVESVVLAVVPPARSFETSIYGAYPDSFWLVFGASLAVAIVLFVVASMRETDQWRGAFALLAANYGLFFFLPLFRGYVLYGRGSSDSLYHLGHVEGILATGGTTLWYPLEHLLLTELALVGVPLAAAAYLLSYVFAMTFVAGTGIFLRRATGTSRALACGLCAATPLLFRQFNVAIHPAILSFLLFPVVLALLERYRQTDSNRPFLLLCAVAFGIVYLHPMTTILLLVLVASTSVFSHLYARFDPAVAPLRLTVVFAVLPAAFAWYYGFPSTTSLLMHAVRGILYGASSPAQMKLHEAAGAALTTSQLAVRFVQLYGAIFVYLAVGGLFCAYVLARLLRRRQSYLESYLSLQFVIGGVVAVSFLGVYLIASGPIRVARYLIMVAVVAVGLLLTRVSSPDGGRDGRRWLAVALTVVVIGATVLSAGTAYQPNEDFTATAYQGIEFVVVHHDPSLPVRALHVTQKMQLFVFGANSPWASEPAFSAENRSNRLVEHLGYDRNATALETFGPSSLVTKQYDTTYYRASYYTPRQRRARFLYDSADLARLRDDPTVQKVYANGGFEAWLVGNRTAVGGPGSTSRR